MSTTNFRIEGGAVSASVEVEGEGVVLVVAVGGRMLRVRFPNEATLEDAWCAMTDAVEKQIGPMYC